MGKGGMIRVGALPVAFALALAACGSEPADSGNGSEGAKSTSTDYTIDTDTGEERMVIATPDGDVAMRSGSDIPIDLPEGFSMMDGAEVTRNTVIDQADGKGALVTFETNDAPEAVANYYRAQAQAAGIDIEVDMTVNESRVIGGKNGSGTTFSLSATPKDTGTRAQLVVGRGDDY